MGIDARAHQRVDGDTVARHLPQEIGDDGRRGERPRHRAVGGAGLAGDEADGDETAEPAMPDAPHAEPHRF